jgi:transcriptional regulator with XRE-family HTH domain
LLAQLGPVLLTNWIAAATSTEISVAMGLAAELRGWLVDIRATGVSASAEVRVTTIHPPPARVERAVPAASITYVQTAALDQQLAGRRNQEYALKLSRIRSLLGVSAAEVARLLGVSREAVRQWEAGAAISEDRWPSIDRLFETCRRLSTYFKIESLPSVVRRSVPALGNQSPLEWLIMQKQDELLAVYERAFGFGVTQ